MNKVSNYDKLLEAFGEKKVKTKHLKQKADKKKAVKKTRSVKQVDFTRKIEYSLSHIIQTNAKNCEAISFLKDKMKKIRQTISE